MYFDCVGERDVCYVGREVHFNACSIRVFPRERFLWLARKWGNFSACYSNIHVFLLSLFFPFFNYTKGRRYHVQCKLRLNNWKFPCDYKLRFSDFLFRCPVQQTRIFNKKSKEDEFLRFSLKQSLLKLKFRHLNVFAKRPFNLETDHLTSMLLIR